SGVATVLPAGISGNVTLASGNAAAAKGLKVCQADGAVVVDTGKLRCSMAKGGSANLVDSMVIDGRTVVGAGQLICIVQTGPDGEAEDVRPREKFASLIKKVTVEQTGPVRAVVKLEGVHKG